MIRRTKFGIVGAAGASGRAVIAELLRTTGHEILAGGRDAAKLSARAAEFGNRVQTLGVDVMERGSLDEFCRACSVVINCAGPVSVLRDRVAQAAWRAGCHYVDPAGMSMVKEGLAPQGAEIAAHGLSFVVSAGWMPGLVDLLPVYASARARASMDSIDAVELYFSDAGEWSESALRDGVAHLRRAGLGTPGFFRRGERVMAKAWEASRKVDVGSPIGLRRFSLFSMPELDAVGRRLTGAEFRSYSYLAGARNAMDAMMIALLPTSETWAVERLRRIFRRNQTAVGGFAIVLVRGQRGGARVDWRTSVTFDPGQDYWINSVVLAALARMIADGEGVRAGVNFLFEAVEPVAFMATLRGAGVRVSEEEVVEARVSNR